MHSTVHKPEGGDLPPLALAPIVKVQRKAVADAFLIEKKKRKERKKSREECAHWRKVSIICC